MNETMVTNPYHSRMNVTVRAEMEAGKRLFANTVYMTRLLYNLAALLGSLVPLERSVQTVSVGVVGMVLLVCFVSERQELLRLLVLGITGFWLGIGPDTLTYMRWAMFLCGVLWALCRARKDDELLLYMMVFTAFTWCVLPWPEYPRVAATITAACWFLVCIEYRHMNSFGDYVEEAFWPRACMKGLYWTAEWMEHIISH